MYPELTHLAYPTATWSNSLLSLGLWANILLSGLLVFILPPKEKNIFHSVAGVILLKLQFRPPYFSPSKFYKFGYLSLFDQNQWCVILPIYHTAIRYSHKFSFICLLLYLQLCLWPVIFQARQAWPPRCFAGYLLCLKMYFPFFTQISSEFFLTSFMYLLKLSLSQGSLFLDSLLKILILLLTFTPSFMRIRIIVSFVSYHISNS